MCPAARWPPFKGPDLGRDPRRELVRCPPRPPRIRRESQVGFAAVGAMPDHGATHPVAGAALASTGALAWHDVVKRVLGCLQFIEGHR